MALAATLASGPLAGQAVRGTITDPQTGAAIDGAIVVLLDAQGKTVAQVLSNDSGRFLLRAPGPGAYALRADRIGHASTYSGTFEVAGTQTVVMDLTAQVEAIQLTGIDVDAERRCVRQPADDGGTAILWEEARKALTAAAWTSDSGTYRYELLYRTRQLDRNARRVESERTRTNSALSQRAFVSHTAEYLLENGYTATGANGDLLYFAPDAAVLLSESFLDTHCFSVRKGSRDAEGLIGLAFEPTPDRRMPDIDGTLWLDPITAELRWLDFRYRNLESGLLDDVVGGRVEFQALPSGNWFVSRWAIRMPILQRQAPTTGRGDRLAIVGVAEEGAQVVGVRDSRGRPVLDFETGTVVGSVRSEFGQTGLGAARVTLVGTNHSVFTDEAGRFTIAGLEEGEYLITYEHPVLDSVGHVPEPVAVEVTLGRASTVSLEAPSRYTTLTQRCTADEQATGLSMLLGHVRDAVTGVALEGATVQVLWSNYDIGSSPATSGARSQGRQASGADPRNQPIGGAMVVVRDRERGYQAQSDAQGFYLFCGVPDDHPLRVSGEWMGKESRQIQIRIDANALYRSYDVALRTNPGS